MLFRKTSKSSTGKVVIGKVKRERENGRSTGEQNEVH